MSSPLHPAPPPAPPHGWEAPLPRSLRRVQRAGQSHVGGPAGARAPLRAQAGARRKLSKPFRSSESHPVPNAPLPRTGLRGAPRFPLQVPEEGRPLPLRVRDKGFPKVPRCPDPWAPFTPTWAVSVRSPEPLPRSRAVRSSRRGARTSHSRGYPPLRALPSMPLPSPGPVAGLWRTPKCALLSSSRPHCPPLHFHTQGFPVSSHRHNPVLDSMPGSRRAWAGVQAARSLCSHCDRRCAGHMRTPHPLPHPSPDVQPPPAAIAASSARGEREAAGSGTNRDTV